MTGSWTAGGAPPGATSDGGCAADSVNTSYGRCPNIDVLADIMAQTQTYAYGSLNPLNAEFRVLKVLPGSREDGLEASLSLVSFNSSPPPQYETISYVWDKPDKVASIVVDGAVLRIPTNNYAALRRVRSELKPRVLWIDAVCINQDDKVERGQQVAMMSSIYRRSSGNMIHLIDDETIAPLLVEALQSCAEEARRDTQDFSGLRAYLLKPQRPGNARPLSERDRSAIHLLLKAP